MIALDTSFLLAAEGRHEARKWRLASKILMRLNAADLVVPAQALAEMLHVMKTVLVVPEDEAGTAAVRWLAATHSASISQSTINAARSLASEVELSLEDALIVVAAKEAGARILLSEDIADGLQYGGMTVVHPFVPIVHPRLEMYLGKGWNDATAVS